MTEKDITRDILLSVIIIPTAILKNLYASSIPKPFMACASAFVCSGESSVNGMRSGPQSFPISSIAFLTGIGFTSQKSFSISGIAFN